MKTIKSSTLSTRFLVILFAILAALAPRLANFLGLSNPHQAPSAEHFAMMDFIIAAAYLGGMVAGGIGMVFVARNLIENTSEIICDKNMAMGLALMALACALLGLVPLLNQGN